VLRSSQLRRSFGDVDALRDVSFTVERGEILGFLGPNGAGKTTAMRAVMGILALDHGSLTWDEHAITAEDRRRFGYMPEERGLYPKMRLGEQLRFLARLHGSGAREADDATSRWARRLSLDERLDARIDELSHGNQQRAQLAAALVHDPDLLVLDEPFSGLDPTGVDALGEVMLEQASGSSAVVFSSHQLDLVERFCRRVVIIDHGAVVLAGTLDELASRGGRRLRVGVGGTNGRWADTLPGVVRVDYDTSSAFVTLDDDADPERVLDAMRTLGPVTHFAVERPPLSVLFREAVER
jgi:ABC-2 type transport system ATP-binding protein